MFTKQKPIYKSVYNSFIKNNRMFGKDEHIVVL